MERHRLPLHVGRLPGQSLRSPIATYWMHHRTRRYYYLIICNKIQSRIFQAEEKKEVEKFPVSLSLMRFVEILPLTYSVCYGDALQSRELAQDLTAKVH